MSAKSKLAAAVPSAIVLLAAVAGPGLWRYHEQPQFCATCHIMDPYLESWNRSDSFAYRDAQEGAMNRLQGVSRARFGFI